MSVDAPTTPSAGQIVRVRSRTWLVEGMEENGSLRLACLDDDAQGDILEVDWDLELDAKIVSDEGWRSIGRKGFDPPRTFAAYLNTLRWNCLSATSPHLFQAPFRAGIKIDAYQIEPLRKALRLPRVNLFIADDVGLGKTIEAGLIASELLLRRRVRDIVVACPPSTLLQWKDELETRFGLTFEIFDRAFVERVRRERGHAVNPWETFPRFLISHKLLIDEAYMGPMRVWLDNLRPGSLLIFDEAHHAAPASSAKYAIDSQITRAARNLASRFEHRLFLSATPHNGHSNSFSALLEILDRERFVRGVRVIKENREAVMVRRLKEDLRAIGVKGFPQRIIEQVDLPAALGEKNLPSTAPELALPALLEKYRKLRLDRMAGASKRQKAQFELLVCNLQQRLLSSVEAFARTIKVHRRTMEKVWAGEAKPQETSSASATRSGPVDSDDDRASVNDEELGLMFDAEAEKATLASAADAAPEAAERKLLEEMESIAERGRLEPDAKIRYLVKWIRENMCAGANLPADGGSKEGAAWNNRRLIIFTEWDDTKRYIVQHLKAAIAKTDCAEERIDVFHGPTPLPKKEELKRAFNTPPDKHALRILVCTDSAREGLNLQAHCHDLFHFDVPWNPARMDQRNGRIDRKLQPAPEVFCRYFFYTQRPEDRVLQALVRKSDTIKEELGSFTDVVSGRLKTGISQDGADLLAQEFDGFEDREESVARKEDLEESRLEKSALADQIRRLENSIEESAKEIQFDAPMLRDAISCSLEMLGSAGLREDAEGRFIFPDLDAQRGADPAWAPTLDTLRRPPESGRRDYAWRNESPIRPVVFKAPDGIDESVVQLHLSHRLVQRLLGRFTSQGFVYDDLSRACFAISGDSMPRVVLLGRLAVYGPGASRLHEEILTVTARWTPPDKRNGPLTPHGRDGEARTMQLLREHLAPGQQKEPPADVLKRISASIAQDIEELQSHLQPRAEEIMKEVVEKLGARGEGEAKELIKLLEDQRKRVLKELDRNKNWRQQELGLNDDEQRQKEADIRYWQAWLENVDGDLAREPARIRDFYTVKSHRIEPVGLVYLWPEKS
jgi:SNF2 family DNA or RNA helicase